MSAALPAGGRDRTVVLCSRPCKPMVSTRGAKGISLRGAGGFDILATGRRRRML